MDDFKRKIFFCSKGKICRKILIFKENMGKKVLTETFALREELFILRL